MTNETVAEYLRQNDYKLPCLHQGKWYHIDEEGNEVPIDETIISDAIKAIANATAEICGVSAQRGALGRSLAATAEVRDSGFLKHSPPWSMTTRHGKFTRVYVIRDSFGGAIADLSFFGNVKESFGAQFAALMVQSPQLKAQRDELQRKFDDITEAYTALRSDSVVITNQRDELLAALKSAHAELIDIKADVELAKSMKLSQTAFEAAEKLDEAQLLIPFSRQRTFEQTKEAARQIIQAAIDAAVLEEKQWWMEHERESRPVTEKQVARELLLIPAAQEKLSDGKLRAPVKGNINYPEDAPRHTLD